MKSIVKNIINVVLGDLKTELAYKEVQSFHNRANQKFLKRQFN